MAKKANILANLMDRRKKKTNTEKLTTNSQQNIYHVYMFVWYSMYTFREPYKISIRFSFCMFHFSFFILAANALLALIMLLSF